MNTTHESEDLEQLKSLAQNDAFAGVRVRIVDETDALRFAPPVREKQGDPSVAGIAAYGGGQKRSYRWTRYALAAVILFFAAAIVWMAVITLKVEQERNFSAPIPTR